MKKKCTTISRTDDRQIKSFYPCPWWECENPWSAKKTNSTIAWVFNVILLWNQDHNTEKFKLFEAQKMFVNAVKWRLVLDFLFKTRSHCHIRLSIVFRFAHMQIQNMIPNLTFIMLAMPCDMFCCFLRISNWFCCCCHFNVCTDISRNIVLERIFIWMLFSNWTNDKTIWNYG